MFEVTISVRVKSRDSEYLALKTHEVLRELGTAELDTVYFSEVVGSVGRTSVALYLSRSNVGVFVVASSCDDEGKCLLGPIKEVARLAREVLRRVQDLVEIVRVDYVVKAKVPLYASYKSVLRGLRMCGVEISDGGSYDAGWYLVRTFKGRYMESMKRLDVVLTMVYEKSGELASVQVSVSRSSQELSNLPDEEMANCLRAASRIIAYLSG